MEKRTAFEHGFIHRNPDSFFRYDGWPSVCKDDEGTLYAAYSGFRARHICPFGKTCLCRSTDEGRTWSAPIVVNDTWLDDRDAGVVCLGGRKIMVTWFTHPVDLYLGGLKNHIVSDWPGSVSVLEQYPSIPEEKSHGGSFVRVSEDGGATWGDIIQLPVSAPHGPIVRRDGSLLYLGKEMWAHDESTPDVIIAMESRDAGRTWTELGRVPLPDEDGLVWNHLHEPHVVELPDGKLIGMIRQERSTGTIYQTESTDGGRTWTMPVPLGVHGLPPHIIEHSSGALVMVFGRREVPFGERAVVSYDGGKTWPDEYVLRDDAPSGDLGYPATVELSDGSLLTVYYQIAQGDSFPSIQYTKWTL